jgi:hypothetical protein
MGVTGQAQTATGSRRRCVRTGHADHSHAALQKQRSTFNQTLFVQTGRFLDPTRERKIDQRLRQRRHIHGHQQVA